MFFYNVRAKFYRKIKDNFNYRKVLFQTSRIRPGDKVIYIDISGIDINRYLYNFLKFFAINNYIIYLPRNKNIIIQLCRDKGEFEYTSWLIKERFVKFENPPASKQLLTIGRDQLSNDYFSSFFKDEFEVSSFHIPMSEYPELYHKSYWKQEFALETKRKRSVFAVGNINEKYYKKIEEDKVFNIVSRRAVADFIYKQEYYIHVSSVLELEKYIQGEIDNKVILIDTSVDFNIEGNKLKKILKCFDFYLAMPGVIIPQSHNLIEAMSVGGVPIIHKTYANLFRPALQNNINCLIYETEEEINDTISSTFKLSEEKIRSLRENVFHYYTNNLSPEAVISKIEKYNYEKFFLQAEGTSLYYLKNPQ